MGTDPTIRLWRESKRPCCQRPKPYLNSWALAPKVLLDFPKRHQVPQSVAYCMRLCDACEMDLLSFIRTADPIKVRVGERQRADGEPRLLETTVGRMVVSSGAGVSASGGQGLIFSLFIAASDTIVVVLWLRYTNSQKKRKTVAVDASGPSHPPKKLREDYGDPSGPSVAGKSGLRLEVALLGPYRMLMFLYLFQTLRIIRANISEAEVDSIVRSSTLIIATVVTTTVDAAATAKETPVKPSLFGAGSSSAGGTDPTPGGFSDVSGSDFLIGGIRTVVEPDFDL
ncbi:hypothetical protein Tco_0000864 [Tanacetum coccineum]